MTQKALYLMSEKSNKPISQKLDEFRDFIYEISKSSCDSFASREECLKYVTFEILGKNAVIIEGVSSFASGFPIPDGLGKDELYPLIQSFKTKNYSVCSAKNIDGYKDTLIVADNDEAMTFALKAYQQKVEKQKLIMQDDFYNANNIDSNKAKREAQIQALKEKVRKASEKIQDRKDKDRGIEL